MKKIMILSICLLSSLLASCASIVSGQNESVSVSTGKVYGANCSLENNKGKWYVPTTPGSVMVHRSYSNLQVVCKKNGYKQAVKSVASSTKPMAFGNVLFGGVIGAGVDVASGAAYDYPTDISVPIARA